MSACSVQVRPLRPWSTCWGLEGDSIIASLRVMEMKMEMETEMAKEKQQPRKSGRIPSSSYRMPSQMKTLFFGIFLKSISSQDPANPLSTYIGKPVLLLLVCA